MFQFPAFASVINGYPGFTGMGCPIRKSPDHRLFAPTRSLSQLVTSFIASESQGIHHAPLFTFLIIFTNCYSFSFSMSKNFYQKNGSVNIPGIEPARSN